MESDWRITNQKSYLESKKIKRSKFQRTERSDHEHCEFCWEKFSEYDGTLHEGFCTLDKYYWICEECFNDFRSEFKWELVDED